MITRWVKKEIKAMKWSEAMQDALREGAIERIGYRIEQADAELRDSGARREAGKRAIKFGAY